MFAISSRSRGAGADPLPALCAQSILTSAADCRRWLFSPAAEGPGVVLFLGVFWSQLQAVNWRQQKD